MHPSWKWKVKSLKREFWEDIRQVQGTYSQRIHKENQQTEGSEMEGRGKGWDWTRPVWTSPGWGGLVAKEGGPGLKWAPWACLRLRQGRSEGTPWWAAAGRLSTGELWGCPWGVGNEPQLGMDMASGSPLPGKENVGLWGGGGFNHHEYKRETMGRDCWVVCRCKEKEREIKNCLKRTPGVDFIFEEQKRGGSSPPDKMPGPEQQSIPCSDQQPSAKGICLEVRFGGGQRQRETWHSMQVWGGRSQHRGKPRRKDVVVS